MSRAERATCRDRMRGVVMLALLLGMALGAIGLMAAMDVWSITRQREREQELLFVGDQYRMAIRRYYFGAPPGQPRTLPTSLSALLDDDRYTVPVHHIRRLYPDPLTGKPDWGLVQVGDQFIGVYSLSEAQPLKQTNFAPAYQHFNDKSSYREWVFAFVIPRRRSTPSPSIPVPQPAPNISPFNPTRPTRGNPA